MKENIIRVENFAKFSAVAGSTGKCVTVTDSDGNETGFEVRGMLTKFNFVNANGMTFEPESYDKFIDEYYIANGLNVPLCLLHDDTDIRNVCGYVKELTKTDDGVEMVAFIPKSTYYYNLIRNYVECGVLQGFSNFGCVTDFDFTEGGALIVKSFELLHAAMVCIPADTSAKFVQNTIFKNFEPSQRSAAAEDEDIDLIV